MQKYSLDLVAEITAYLKEKDGKDTTPEEAEEYLDSLADLYHLMQESIRQGFGLKIKS